MSKISSKNIKSLSVPQSPVVLAILDGWGYRKEKSDNAIKSASTPIMDSLWHAYPHTLISASGSDVGLPDGQMGNSEVGFAMICVFHSQCSTGYRFDLPRATLASSTGYRYEIPGTTLASI